MSADLPISPTLSPVLHAANATQAIEFYCSAFGACERYRLTDPKSGRITHAELQMGDSVLMISQSAEGSPAPSGVKSVQLSLGVINVDAAVESAVRAGATLLRPPADQFYGYRCANLRDPLGFEWMLSQKIESLAPQEMQRRCNLL